MQTQMTERLASALAKIITTNAAERGTDPHAVMSRIETAVARAEAKRATRARVKRICAEARRAAHKKTDWVERLQAQINGGGGATSWD